jgi:hypothetical protein
MNNQVKRCSELIVHSGAPPNAEPPLARLRAAFLTSRQDFYIRLHGALLDLDAATRRITIGGRIACPQQFTLAELQTWFARRIVTAVTQCAGNRRADMQALAPVSGESWAPGAIGGATWTGVPMADILPEYGSDIQPGLHVAFACADECEMLVRVDVPTDEGRSWQKTGLQTDASLPWSWTLPPGEHVLVRAWDDASQTQRNRTDGTWNYKDYLCNAWHRVPVIVA